jgi:DNA-binding NarL/FixJ family response regulator
MGIANPTRWRGEPARFVCCVSLQSVAERDSQSFGRRQSASRKASRRASNNDECPVTSLGERERQISLMVTAGFEVANVAALTGLAESTIRTVLKRVYRKTGTHSRVELAQWLAGFSTGAAVSRAPRPLRTPGSR